MQVAETASEGNLGVAAAAGTLFAQNSSSLLSADDSARGSKKGPTDGGKTVTWFRLTI